MPPPDMKYIEYFVSARELLGVCYEARLLMGFEAA